MILKKSITSLSLSLFIYERGKTCIAGGGLERVRLETGRLGRKVFLGVPSHPHPVFLGL